MGYWTKERGLKVCVCVCVCVCFILLHCHVCWFNHTPIWKEGNVLFNDALNTFYLWLYGMGYMVKDRLDSERGNPMPPHGLLFPISSKNTPC